MRWINHKIAKKKRKEIGEQRKVKKKEEKPKKEIHQGQPFPIKSHTGWEKMKG